MVYSQHFIFKNYYKFLEKSKFEEDIEKLKELAEDIENLKKEFIKIKDLKYKPLKFTARTSPIQYYNFSSNQKPIHNKDYD